jgi:hypothetical protein
VSLQVTANRSRGHDGRSVTGRCSGFWRAVDSSWPPLRASRHPLLESRAMDESQDRHIKFHARTAFYIFAAACFFFVAQWLLSGGMFGLGYIEAMIYASIVVAVLWHNKRLAVPEVKSEWIDRAVVIGLPFAALVLAWYLVRKRP